MTKSKFFIILFHGKIRTTAWNDFDADKTRNVRCLSREKILSIAHAGDKIGSRSTRGTIISRRVLHGNGSSFLPPAALVIVAVFGN